MTKMEVGRPSAVLALLLLLLPPTAPCPAACVCKWKGGKQTVECLNKGLAVLPDGMDTGTQVLEFSGNNLQVLGRDRFLRAGLLHLQRIYVSRCRLGSIDDHAFRGLANLVELDLSDNLLSRLPSPEAFSAFPSLMRLSLSSNPIRRVPSRAFHPLSALVTLEMSGCEVDSVEDGAFLGLDSLEWLKLDGNRLRTIADVLPASLHGVDLHHNPWHCDCRLQGLRAWLLRYNIPHSIEPRCSTPARLATRPVKALPPRDLACLPDVSPTAMFLEIAEGRNASLLCRVSAVPDATVSWWFRGRILQNATLVAPGLHLYYFLEDAGSGTPSAGQEKRSELFIINANAAEGNGTYACVAENAAGAAQSNYTVRIVVREERAEGVEVEAAATAILPPEYAVVVISAGVAALVLLVSLSAAVAALALRCRRRRRRRRKKERSKAAAALSDHSKADLPRPSGAVGPQAAAARGDGAKANGAAVPPQSRLHHEMTMMGASASVVLANTGMGHRQRPGGATAVATGVAPPGAGGSERNPDLINDATGGGSEGAEKAREAGDGEEKAAEGAEAAPLCRLPAATAYRFHAADVHPLSPGRFLDSDGYPIDYGLPRIPPLSLPLAPAPGDHFYRTLPHRRAPASAAPRYSRDAEYFPVAVVGGNYEPPVRHQREGYPYSSPPTATTPDDPAFLPSPPAAYKGGDTPQCCAEEQQPQQQQALQESPDEGYEGDGTEI